MKTIMFVDGSDRIPGCNCGPDCSMPCWQRIGIAPACETCKCAPFAEEVPGDRANELRNMPDLWPIIRQHLGQHRFSEDDLEAKFRKGEAQHGRDWLNMTRRQLEREVESEWLDLALYTAMIRARFGAGDHA